jgi:hypothetical protein
MNMHACAHVRGMLQNSPLLPTGDGNVFSANALQAYLSKNLPTANPLLPTDAHWSEGEIDRFGLMNNLCLVAIFGLKAKAEPPGFAV